MNERSRSKIAAELICRDTRWLAEFLRNPKCLDAKRFFAKFVIVKTLAIYHGRIGRLKLLELFRTCRFKRHSVTFGHRRGQHRTHGDRGINFFQRFNFIHKNPSGNLMSIQFCRAVNSRRCHQLDKTFDRYFYDSWPRALFYLL